MLTIKPGFMATKMIEGTDLHQKLTAQPEEVDRDIYEAQQKGKDVLYTKWIWKYIMLIIKLIAEWKFRGDEYMRYSAPIQPLLSKISSNYHFSKGKVCRKKRWRI